MPGRDNKVRTGLAYRPGQGAVGVAVGLAIVGVLAVVALARTAPARLGTSAPDLAAPGRGATDLALPGPTAPLTVPPQSKATVTSPGAPVAGAPGTTALPGATARPGSASTAPPPPAGAQQSGPGPAGAAGAGAAGAGAPAGGAGGSGATNPAGPSGGQGPPSPALAAAVATANSGALHFGYLDASLTPAAQAVLDGLAGQLAQEPVVVAVIQGHTDSIGPEDGNLRLSQRRADAVAAHLLARGVAPSQLVTAALGATNPVADDATEAGQAANRRVDIILRVDAAPRQDSVSKGST